MHQRAGISCLHLLVSKAKFWYRMQMMSRIKNWFLLGRLYSPPVHLSTRINFSPHTFYHIACCVNTCSKREKNRTTSLADHHETSDRSFLLLSVLIDAAEVPLDRILSWKSLCFVYPESWVKLCVGVWGKHSLSVWQTVSLQCDVVSCN